MDRVLTRFIWQRLEKKGKIEIIKRKIKSLKKELLKIKIIKDQMINS